MLERTQVDHLAALARLNLTLEEKERFQAQLGDILAYINKLKTVDVTGAEPMAGALPVTNVLRDDIPHESLPQSAALSNAPDRIGAFFKVPRIIEGAEEGDNDASM